MSADGAKRRYGLEILHADLEALSPVLEEIESRDGLLSPSELEWSKSAPSPSPNRMWRRLGRIALRGLLARAWVPQARRTHRPWPNAYSR